MKPNRLEKFITDNQVSIPIPREILKRAQREMYNSRIPLFKIESYLTQKLQQKKKFGIQHKTSEQQKKPIHTVSKLKVNPTLIKETINPRTIKREPILLSSIQEADRLTPFDFEILIAAIFENDENRVSLTPKSGDQGADIIIQYLGTKTAIQVKQASAGRTVSNRAIHEVVGSLAFYDAKHAFVVTNSFFSTSAKELARVNQVKLLNRSWLTQKIKERGPFDVIKLKRYYN